MFEQLLRSVPPHSEFRYQSDRYRLEGAAYREVVGWVAKCWNRDKWQQEYLDFNTTVLVDGQAEGVPPHR